MGRGDPRCHPTAQGFIPARTFCRICSSGESSTFGPLSSCSYSVNPPIQSHFYAGLGNGNFFHPSIPTVHRMLLRNSVSHAMWQLLPLDSETPVACCPRRALA